MKAPKGWEDVKYMLAEDSEVRWSSLREAIADCKGCVGDRIGDDCETIYRVTFTPVRRVEKRDGKMTVENLEKERDGHFMIHYGHTEREAEVDRVRVANDYEIVEEPAHKHPDVLCVECGNRAKWCTHSPCYYCAACASYPKDGPPADEESVWGAKLVTQDNKSAFAGKRGLRGRPCEYPPGIWKRIDGMGCFVAVGDETSTGSGGLCAGGRGDELKVAFMECRELITSGCFADPARYRWVRQSPEPHPELLREGLKAWARADEEKLSDEQKRTLLGKSEPETDYIDVPVSRTAFGELVCGVPYPIGELGKGRLISTGSWLSYWPHCLGPVFEAPDGALRLGQGWTYLDSLGKRRWRGTDDENRGCEQAKLVAVRFRKEAPK